MAFLKDSCPLTDSITKIMTIRSPAFSSPVTLLILENPKGKLMQGKLWSLWCLQCFDISWKSEWSSARAFHLPLSCHRTPQLIELTARPLHSQRYIHPQTGTPSSCLPTPLSISGYLKHLPKDLRAALGIATSPQIPHNWLQSNTIRHYL